MFQFAFFAKAGSGLKTRFSFSSDSMSGISGAPWGLAAQAWGRRGAARARVQEDPLETRAVEQMTIGVSTRKYERSLEGLDADLDVRGTKRSSVSRRFVVGTQKKVDELNKQLEDKKAKLEALAEELKGMSATDMLGEGAKKLQADSDKLTEEIREDDQESRLVEP